MALVNPGQALHLRILVEHGGGAGVEAFHIQLVVGDLARHASQLLLTLQQAQTQALLRVFHVALHRLLFAVEFFRAQVGESGHDSGEKQGNRQQRRQHGEPVLEVRILP